MTLATTSPAIATTPATPDALEFTIDAAVSQTAIAVIARSGHERHLVRTFAPDSDGDDLTGLLPTVSRIEALDVLEHVIDEEALLDRIVQLLLPGGTLVVRVPVEGPITWLDALNLYRYLQDTTGLGKRLDETKMKGWHRHYRERELAAMLAKQGLDVTGRLRSGSPHLDVVQFGGLAWGTIVRKDDDVERRLKAWRDRAEAGVALPRLGPFSTRITMQAVKPRPGSTS